MTLLKGSKTLTRSGLKVSSAPFASIENFVFFIKILSLQILFILFVFNAKRYKYRLYNNLLCLKLLPQETRLMHLETQTTFPI